MNNRLIWMDTLRGFLIFVVIIQHWKTHIPQINRSEWWYIFINELVKISSPLRMELLFFLSGLLVYKGMEKPFRRYLNSKSQNIFYPYLIWSFIYLIIYTKSSLIDGNYSESLKYLLRIIFGTGDITWFLFFLLIYYISIKSIRNLNAVPVVIISILLCIGLKKIKLPFFLNVGFTSISDFFYYFIFFYLGDQFIKSNINLTHLLKSKFILSISFISLLIVTYINYKFNAEKTHPIYLIPVLGSIPIIIASAIKITKKKQFFTKIFSHFGVNSIYYYLMHVAIIIITHDIINYFNILPNTGYILKITLALLIPYIIVISNKKILFLNYLFTSKDINIINRIKSKFLNI